MKAGVASTCQTCGARVPSGLDFCPVCALVQAGDQESAPSEALNPLPDSERSSVEAEPASIVRRFENYEVLLDQGSQPIELGRGAMGVTYKAFDVDLLFPVTLKVISEKYVGDESARLRFLREARAAAKVRHPNVASVFHLGRIGGGYFYAMEYVEGETLESRIKHCGCLEVKLALEIAIQVAAGLAAVHKQNLVHRDIKPSNIIVALEPGSAVTAKIIDLGLAKAVSEPGSESEISTPGVFAGTPVFASPEQFAGLGADIRSDLYSLGVTLWEMLAGQAPFQGSPSELMHKHQHAPLPLEQLKGLPQPVVVLLEVMLEKDPAQRFQEPAELLKAIPLVTAAIDAGRRVTPHDLRTTSEEGALQKSGKFSDPLRAFFRSARVRLAARLLGVLLIGGAVVILAVNLVNRPAAKFPVSPSVSIEAPEKSIAVLPFENISANKDDVYFADGVQDEILNNLAKIAELKVISRTSVMKYQGDSKRDLRQIAIALGVANVLEGTVRREGNHVRVSTELVDARNDTTIWADRYDRDLTDIFAIQSEIAQQVASKLSAQLSPREQKDVEEKPTENLEAYDLYLQARQQLEAKYWTDWGDTSELKSYSKIIGLLEEAIQKDGKFALAYCLMAKAHDTLYLFGADHTPERRALSEAAINEALRLRPDLPEVHLAMAGHLYLYRDFERARVQIAIAAQTRPNNAEVLELTALIDRAQGRWEKSTAGLEKAASLDPRSVTVLGGLAGNYESLRRYRDWRRILDRLIELEPNKPEISLSKPLSAFFEKADVKGTRDVFEALPSSIKDGKWVRSMRVYLAICSSDFAAAAAIINQDPTEELYFPTGASAPAQIYALLVEFLEGKHPTTEEFGAAREQLYRKVEEIPDSPFLMELLAYADASLGRKAEAIEEGRRAMEIKPISEDAEFGPGIAADVAMMFAMVNESESAFELLTILVKMPAALTYGDLKTDPGWDSLRKDPRFDKLLTELAPRD